MVGASDHVGMDKIFGTYRFNGDAELGRAKPADDENLVNNVDDIERLVLEHHFAILNLAHVEHIVDE